VIPGGSSVPLSSRAHSDELTMDFDTLRNLKSGLGTAAVIVMDKSTDVIKAIWRISPTSTSTRAAASARRAAKAPAGCGASWSVMVKGKAQKREIDMLFDVTKQVEGHTICALGDAAAWPIQGLIRHFRPLIEARIDAVPRRNAVPMARRCRRRSKG
jgi:NADH-quinone oxidoreductase subunit F